jgi:hypothetical protein
MKTELLSELKPTENVSVVWDFNVSNAIKADTEWWEYRNGCLRMWGDLGEANAAAYRRIFKITGRRMKAWVSLLPNA